MQFYQALYRTVDSPIKHCRNAVFEALQDCILQFYETLYNRTVFTDLRWLPFSQDCCSPIDIGLQQSYCSAGWTVHAHVRVCYNPFFKSAIIYNLICHLQFHSAYKTHIVSQSSNGVDVLPSVKLIPGGSTYKGIRRYYIYFVDYRNAINLVSYNRLLGLLINRIKIASSTKNNTL